MRERLDRRTRAPVEQLGDLAVQPYPLVGTELLEQRLAHERVREAQSSGAALDLDDELRGDGFVELIGCEVLVDLQHRRDETGIELTAEHRGRPQQVVGRVGKPGQSLPDHIAHTFGQTRLARRHRADPNAVDLHQRTGLDEVPQHLGHEERIAVGLGCESPSELEPRRLEPSSARGFEERAHAGFVEAVQRDALGAGRAVQIGKRAGQGMATVDVGVAVRHQHEDVRVRIDVADDMTQQMHTARVGPVRIVEQHDDRLCLGSSLENVDDRVEQQQSFGVGIRRCGRGSGGRAAGKFGHETGELTSVMRNVFDDHVVGRAGHD